LICRQALKADALRPKSQRRAAKVLLAQIKPEGYEGGAANSLRSSAPGAVSKALPVILVNGTDDPINSVEGGDVGFWGMSKRG